MAPTSPEMEGAVAVDDDGSERPGTHSFWILIYLEALQFVNFFRVNDQLGIPHSFPTQLIHDRLECEPARSHPTFQTPLLLLRYLNKYFATVYGVALTNVFILIIRE